MAEAMTTTGVNTWRAAVKMFNEGKPNYVIPKKGSKEYLKVKKIQKKLDKERGAKKVEALATKVKKTKPKKEVVKKQVEEQGSDSDDSSSDSGEE